MYEVQIVYVFHCSIPLLHTTEWHYLLLIILLLLCFFAIFCSWECEEDMTVMMSLICFPVLQELTWIIFLNHCKFLYLQPPHPATPISSLDFKPKHKPVVVSTWSEWWYLILCYMHYILFMCVLWFKEAHVVSASRTCVSNFPPLASVGRNITSWG